MNAADIKISGLQTVGEITQAWVARQDKLRAGIYTHIDTGIKSIDEKFEALLEAGELIVIAARPSMGKSAFAQQIVENIAAKSDTSVLFVSAEMNSGMIINRSIMRRSAVNSHRLLHPGLQTDEDQIAIAVAGGEFNSLNLYIDTSSALEGIVERAELLATTLKTTTSPLKLIVVDYLQYLSLLDPSKANANENYIVGKFIRELSKLGKRLNVPIVVLSQLSRKCEERAIHRPMLSDLRESGNIEQDADSVITLYRDDYYAPDSVDRGLVEVSRIKARNGELGTIKLRWTPERILFSEVNENTILTQRKPVVVTPVQVPAAMATPAATPAQQLSTLLGKAIRDDY
jgi:replicative DNA helicase